MKMYTYIMMLAAGAVLLSGCGSDKDKKTASADDTASPKPIIAEQVAPIAQLATPTAAIDAQPADAAPPPHLPPRPRQRLWCSPRPMYWHRCGLIM